MKEKKIKCCKHHNNMENEYGYYECGMAGVGAGYFCCKKCPDLKWQLEHQPTRPVEYFKPMTNQTKESKEGI